MSPGPDVIEQLRIAREDYARQLPHKLALAERSLRDGQDIGALRQLRFLVHGLAGSGATLGYPEVSETARQLERIVATALDSGRFLSKVENEIAGGLLQALNQAARKPAAGMPSLGAATTIPPGVERKLIYLVEDDAESAAELALQLNHFGYRVETFATPEHLSKTVVDRPPAAVITDIMFSAGDLAGAEAIEKLVAGKRLVAPVIFTSVRDDLHARLAATRAGASDYIVKPVDVRSLVDTLDILTLTVPPESYRVLIVDDTKPLAEHYAATLQCAGIVTDVATDPMRVLAHLVDFKPDLVLMDMYMPDCTGAELAAVIRQLENYASIPIVFLSTESDTSKQLAAMRLGGDDFLTKPIAPEHLVAAVFARLRRYHDLRSYMARDSLTGLLNHAATKEHLIMESTRASRQNYTFAFAMLDLDHFKTINDTYGHSIGDRVLKSLAVLLKGRLRQTDVIGRVGGEEFAVILPLCHVEEAVRVLDELRRSFSDVRHRAESSEFRVSFSCGVTENHKGQSADEVYAFADRALYQAKQTGRNRVVMTT